MNEYRIKWAGYAALGFSAGVFIGLLIIKILFGAM
jgi:hypothetical protein